MNENKGIMLTKIELTLEQSQQGICNDILNIRVILFSIHSDDGNPSRAIIKQALRESYALSWKPCQRDSSKLNLPDHSLTPVESDSLPHAHTQAIKTYYKHQDSRIKKGQELNTKTSTNSDIQDLPKDIKIIKTKIVKGDC
ncbi:hypothetical protein Tco_0672398 [Tanacetum coccineum]